MAKFDPYEFCRTHPAPGQKTPLKDTETGLTVILPGLPRQDEMTPAGLAAYAKATSATIGLPKKQVDATHTTKQKGGKYVGELAEAFMVGWLGVDAAEAPPPPVVPAAAEGNGHTNRLAGAKK